MAVNGGQNGFVCALLRSCGVAVDDIKCIGSILAELEFAAIRLFFLITLTNAGRFCITAKPKNRTGK